MSITITQLLSDVKIEDPISNAIIRLNKGHHVKHVDLTTIQPTITYSFLGNPEKLRSCTVLDDGTIGNIMEL